MFINIIYMFDTIFLMFSKIRDSLTKPERILFNISSSSAFIEKFFSITGIICSQRRNNIKDDLIIMKSLLKSNVKILKEMNELNDIYSESE